MLGIFLSKSVCPPRSGYVLFHKQERKLYLSGSNPAPSPGGFIPFLFPVEPSCLDGWLPVQQQEGPPRKKIPQLSAPQGPPFTGSPGPLTSTSHPSPLPTPRHPPLSPTPRPRESPGHMALGRDSAAQEAGTQTWVSQPAESHSFLEDILALCLHRGAALPGNMAVTAGG